MNVATAEPLAVAAMSALFKLLRRAYCHSATTPIGSCITRLVPCASCCPKPRSPSMGRAITPPVIPKVPET